MLDACFRFGATIFAALRRSLRRIVGSTLYDLYFSCFSPEVMVQLTRKGKGTLRDSNCRWHASSYVHF